MSLPLFVDVILPLALPKLYTYSIPEGMHQEVKVGTRVVVQFGKRKLYSAITHRVHSQPPSEYHTKDILQVIDSEPVVTPKQLEYWGWLADYYMCSLGEVMKAALPSGLKMESETLLTVSESFRHDEHLSDAEQTVMDAMRGSESVTITQLVAKAGGANPMRALRQLLDRQLLAIHEQLDSAFKPKVEIYVRLHSRFKTESDVNQLFEALDRAQAQQKLLMAFLALTAPSQSTLTGWVTRKDLMGKAQVSAAVLSALVEKNVFEVDRRITTRLDFEGQGTQTLPDLTPHQQEAFLSITNHFAEKCVVLLHGVTSSGKTEIYVRLMAEQLRAGKQVLYLLPEIALTAQIIRRLKGFFGNRVGIYHSKFSDNQRVEVYQNLLANGNGPDCPSYDIILGVRSSIFLPFKRLGLIIVDEEHESSFKQHNPSPRYNARDASIVLASMQGAKVLLGTATPSFESFHNAIRGKYGYVSLTQRYMDVKLPEILIINTRELRKRKRMQSFFSPDLVSSIGNARSKGNQVILFQNRRGYAPMVECEECAWVPQCKHCAVSLTYHASNNQLVCHYCGYSTSTFSQCSACGSGRLSSKGFGTERIEDELTIFFPSARVQRMDMDSTRSRSSYDRIISDFEQGNTDILVGTQMITKGLDFSRVSLVGILNADNLLNFPDFRASERGFQLMAQVSGRAGRRDTQGLVIIQTSQPENEVIKDIVSNSFESLYQREVGQRHLYGYPPFSRLVKLSLRHRNANVLGFAAQEMGKQLRQHLGNRVLGPEDPLINRIQNCYIKDILIKLEKGLPLEKTKKTISDLIVRFKEYKHFSGVFVAIDVDPM